MYATQIQLGKSLSSMFTITADVKQVLLMSQWVDAFDEAFIQVDNLAKMANILGADLDKNFASEGRGYGRGWQPLAKMTQDVREERGIPREHPILQQTKKLREVAINPLLYWSAFSTAPKSLSGAGVAFNGSMVPGRQLRAQITGDKVANNRGGKIPYTRKEYKGRQINMFLPPRPFFFISQKANDAMVQSYCNSLMLNWKVRSPRGLNTRISYGNMFSVAPNAKSSRGKVSI